MDLPSTINYLWGLKSPRFPRNFATLVSSNVALIVGTSAVVSMVNLFDWMVEVLIKQTVLMISCDAIKSTTSDLINWNQLDDFCCQSILDDWNHTHLQHQPVSCQVHLGATADSPPYGIHASVVPMLDAIEHFPRSEVYTWLFVKYIGHTSRWLKPNFRAMTNLWLDLHATGLCPKETTGCFGWWPTYQQVDYH